MSKQLWLRLNGSLEQGFEVAIDIRDHNQIHGIEAEGELPANPKLAQRLAEWRQSYHDLPGVKRIILDEVIVEMINPREVCLQKRDALEQCFKDWLLSSSFRAIERQIQAKVNPGDALRMVIRTQDKRLHHLPWHLWDLVEEDYKHAEVALATRAKPFERVRKPGETVKVLAILGDSKGIDTESDCEQLKQLPNAEVTFLSERPRQDINDHLWDQDWDILFFAGHSRTEQTQGRIYINSKDSLTIKELKYGLERAIARGLQLAIFNSCDGLGLAYELEPLHLPQLIVMREPVPDRVAQEFLKRFLAAFAERGESLYEAERYARERLQGLEGEFPCASWLPVIVQNPAVIPPTWAELWQPPPEPEPTPAPKRPTRYWQRLLTVMATSVVVTGVVMGVRSLGWLQTWEFKAYDQLMRVRPEEGPDNRLLVVAITNEDLQLPEQRQRQGSLSDLALSQLLQKLESYQPRVIGLDIHRDFPIDSGLTDLSKYVRTSKKFFAICKVGIPSDNNRGRASLLGLPLDQQGFSNAVGDSDDVVRRHLLAGDPPATSQCGARYNLSVKLAMYYLAKDGIQNHIWNNQIFQIGNTEFSRLASTPGAYKQDETLGIQVILNYRPYNSPSSIADVVTLKQVLANEVNPNLVKDRIVLIGAIHSETNDYHLTPYSTSRAFDQQVAGVILQAQMVSQIIRAVKDGRPLISFLPGWTDLFWVVGWSIAGGLLVWKLRTRLLLVLMGIASIAALCGICYYLLLIGKWIPLIPALLAFSINTWVNYSVPFLQRKFWSS